MTPIKTVLFDLGNVLVDIDLNAFWRNLGLTHPEEIAPFADGYASWTRQYENGHVATADYLSGLQIVFNKKFSCDRLQRAFSGIIQKPIAGMFDIVSRLSCTHQTALVSNTNEIHFTISQKKLAAVRILHKYYLSYQLHVMKPAAGFYHAIIQEQGTSPSMLLFIDDLADNVKAAEVAGIQAIQFKNPEQLNNDLQALHIF